MSAVCLYLLGKNVQENYEQLPHLKLDFEFFVCNLATTALFCITQFSGAVIFYMLVSWEEFRPKFFDCLQIQARANLGKYLLGNVVHLAGKFLLATKAGLRKEVVIAAMALENALAALAAIAMSLPFVMQHPQLVEKFVAEGMSWKIYAAVIVAGVFVGFAAFKFEKVVAFYHKVRPTLRPMRLIGVLLINVVDYFIFALGLVILQKFFGVAESLHVLDYCWGFALAWIIGVIVPVGPAGIGVREFVLVTIYGARLGVGPASALFLLIRLNSILGDLVFFAVVEGARFLRRDQNGA
ncbi:MAG: lysylphosphatidylglycerol synthase domain-containing protein [Oligoflexales bacterium]